jgi:hypothetical protein
MDAFYTFAVAQPRPPAHCDADGDLVSRLGGDD